MSGWCVKHGWRWDDAVCGATVATPGIPVRCGLPLRDGPQQEEIGLNSGPEKASDKQVGGCHYKDFPMQPAFFCESNGLSFLESCAIKRLCRWRRGGAGIKDLQKAKHEIDLLIEMGEWEEQ